MRSTVSPTGEFAVLIKFSFAQEDLFSTMEQPQPSRVFPGNASFVFLNDRGLRAGWRLLIFLGILYLMSSLASLIVGGRAAQGGPASEFFSHLLRMAANLAVFLAVWFAAWLMSRLERRSVGAYGLPLQQTAVGRFFRGYVLWGFIPLTVLLLVMRLLGVFYFGRFSVLNAEMLAWALLWGATFLGVGLLEEYLFRGYTQFTLADGIGFWPAAIILSIAFGAVHMGNPGETRIGIVGASAFGIFAAATLWRTGDLWLAVGAHAGWDWGQSFFFGVNDSGFQAPGHLLNPSSQGPPWLSGGSVGPEGSVLCLILLTLMTVVFLALHRRPPKARVAITNQPESSPGSFYPANKEAGPGIHT